MNEIINNVLIDNFFDNSQFNESLNFEDAFSRINVNFYDEYNLGDGSLVHSLVDVQVKDVWSLDRRFYHQIESIVHLLDDIMIASMKTILVLLIVLLLMSFIVLLVLIVFYKMLVKPLTKLIDVLQHIVRV